MIVQNSTSAVKKKNHVIVVSTVLFLVVIANLFYGWLLHELRLANILPATCSRLHIILANEGIEVAQLINVVNNHYHDVSRYLAAIKKRGNLFHSTTLGVFWQDPVMADYMQAHQQYQEPLITVAKIDEYSNIKISDVIFQDITYANQLFSEALLARNPFRLKKLVKAEAMLYELKCILNQQVGGRVHGSSLTFQLLKTREH